MSIGLLMTMFHTVQYKRGNTTSLITKSMTPSVTPITPRHRRQENGSQSNRDRETGGPSGQSAGKVETGRIDQKSIP
jgi:hypothetical protein